jgi:hypothetical protein
VYSINKLFDDGDERRWRRSKSKKMSSKQEKVSCCHPSTPLKQCRASIDGEEEQDSKIYALGIFQTSEMPALVL